MPTLLLSFPGRRYHATPWGHHVNEGLIEWPPSPWRMLRALLSVGYTSLGWDGLIHEPWRSSPPDTARELLLALAAVEPRYALPPANGAHSRHYMPMGDFKNGDERSTLVFDTWAQIESGELAVTWDVELPPEQTELLAALARGIGYLGRSESWVEARLAKPDEVMTIQHNCFSCVTAHHPGPGWEQVGLLAPVPVEEYDPWRAGAVARDSASLPAPTGRGKTGAKQQAALDAVVAMYPPDLMSCLQVDSNWLRQYGWSQPPGSRRSFYWRRSDSLQAPTARAVGARGGQSVRAILLSLTSQTGNDHALPALARSLPQAEMLHRQVLGVFGRLGHGRHSQVLSGCDTQGRPLRGRHDHAHLLGLDLDDDGHIDHFLVWADEGLPQEEQEAIRRVRSTYTRGGVGALRLAWVGAGDLEDLRALPAPQGLVLDRSLGAGREWVSATPFVPPRHPKKRGTNTLEGQVLAELASRGLPMPRAVEWLDPQRDERARRLRHHVRTRHGGPVPPVDAGFTLRMSFDVDVSGPLCLGYGSHFGLGRFELARG
jgi:CRISPR-associated protein Csb2